jgi:hypothetical protein
MPGAIGQVEYSSGAFDCQYDDVGFLHWRLKTLTGPGESAAGLPGRVDIAALVPVVPLWCMRCP